MLRSFRFGSVFGIPLYLNPTFLLLPLYVLAVRWSEGAADVLFSEAVLLAAFGCVLLHELGHALMARFFGIPTRDITLYPIGGVARRVCTGHQPHEEIAIAAAGPAVNLAIVVLLAPLVLLALAAGLIQSPGKALAEGGWAALAATFLGAVCVSNLGLLLFNLLPVFPMDGGRVLRALLSLRMPRLRATEIAATVGLVLAGCLGLVGLLTLAPGLVLVSVFVAFAGQMELAALRRQEAASQAEVLDVEPLEPILLPPGPRAFTGLAWDRNRGVWVRWVNGVPLD